MRRISKTAALFGIGAIALILAVLGTVAAPGTASADGSEPAVQRDELCTYSTFERDANTFYREKIFPETRDRTHGTTTQYFEVTVVEVVEVEQCLPDRNETRVLRTYERERFLWELWLPNEGAAA